MTEALTAAGAVSWWKDGAIIAVVCDRAPAPDAPPGSDAFWESLAAGSERRDDCGGALAG